MIRYILPALLSTALISSAPASEAADIKTLIKQKQESGLKQAPPPETVPYSYLVTADIKSGEGDDQEAYIARYRVNPQAAPGNRLNFVDQPIESFPEAFQEQMAKMNAEGKPEDFAGEFWCTDDDDDDNMSPDDITVLREDDREAIITLSNEALRDMMKMDSGDGEEEMPKKLRKRLTAELTIAKPDLTMKHMKVWLTKPTTIKIVAKIKQMNIEQSCDIAPNGVPYVTQRKARVVGKALGSSFSENSVITISDLQPL